MTARDSACGVPGTPGASGPPSGWTARKLSEICDADQRTTRPATAAIAAVVPIEDGQAVLPDPYGQRERFHAVMAAARAHLAEEPSARSVQAAAGRLTTAITELARDMARTKNAEGAK